MALRFAAVEFTKGIFLGNLAGELSYHPTPDVPNKVHRATSTAFTFTLALGNLTRSPTLQRHSDAAGEGAIPAITIGGLAPTREVKLLFRSARLLL